MDNSLDQMPNITLNKYFNNFGFKISTQGMVIQVDPNANNIEFNLGNYAGIYGSTAHFTGGTFCPDANMHRKSQIYWKCGSKFELTELFESPTCDYHFNAIIPCCDFDNTKKCDLSTRMSSIFDRTFVGNESFQMMLATRRRLFA